MTEVRKTAVQMLTDQHEHIRKLFGEVAESAGEKRQLAFAELRRLLAVHEAAEEVVTHPAAKSAAPEVVAGRLEEEHRAKELLADLEKTEPSSVEFDEKLAVLRAAVEEHAAAEERLEFPLLEASWSQDDQLRAAEALRTVENIAPTHPHPAAGESAVGNLIAAPVAALADRARDLVSAALRR